MKKRNVSIAIAVLIVLTAGVVFGGIPEKLQKEFTGKDKIKIEAVSGDVVVLTRSGNKISVNVVYDVTPKDAFTPVIREQGKTLRLKEEWRGNRSTGTVTWNLTVPPETEIEFEAASGDISASGLQKSFEAKSASGDIELTDMKGNIDVSTASGDVTLENISGDIEVNTASGEVDGDNLDGSIDISCASGDIKINKAKGGFDLSCASGDLDIRDIVLTGDCEFSAASGDVVVSLANTAAYDLSVSSASGDAVLDYNGNDIKGSFEMQAKKRGGRIVCPFPFDHEEEFEAWGQTYIKKTFTRSGDSPVVKIHSASGKAVLRK